MDFCNVIDIYGSQIYFLVLINYGSRELIYINTTLNPTREWLIQQFRNMSINDSEFPKFLIIDNDGNYGNWIDPVLDSYFEIKVLRTDRGCPWQNGRVERFIKSLKLELLLRIPVSDSVFLNRTCSRYKSYYNNCRPHQGIDGCTPNKDDTKRQCHLENPQPAQD
jgi:putative transposase